MAAPANAGFKPAYTLSGGPPAILYFPLVTATAYKIGNVLRISATSGSAAKQVAAGTAILGVAVRDVALTSASVTKMPVWIADGNTVFEAKKIVTGVPQNNVGDPADIVVGSVYNYRINTAASTKVAKIVGYHPDEATTAHTGCRYYVMFEKSIFGNTARQAGPG